MNFTLATSCEELTHWKRLWCWEGLGARGEGDDRGWDVWMASLTRWTWIWVNSGSWWWTGGLACCDLRGCKESDMTERLNWTELKPTFSLSSCTFIKRLFSSSSLSAITVVSSASLACKSLSQSLFPRETYLRKELWSSAHSTSPQKVLGNKI